MTRIVRVTPGNQHPYLVPLSEMYCACFAEPPWHEVFHAAEVADDFRSHLAEPSTIFLVALNDDNEVLGATIYYAFHLKAQVVEALGSAAVDWQAAIYCDELFVARQHRQHGIASQLVEYAHTIALSEGYHDVVLRTSMIHPPLVHFYTERGFQKIGWMECTSLKYQNGHAEEVADPRTIFGRQLNHRGDQLSGKAVAALAQ